MTVAGIYGMVAYSRSDVAWDDKVRYGMVWYGSMAWYDMVWHGMAWYGMVRHGMTGMLWYNML